VGDYTRRLANECIRQGHECTVLGLTDSSIQGEALYELQFMDGNSIPVLRLPRVMPWSERLANARKYIRSFNPDWISLQYVCYGYHPKGLAWRWNSPLAAFGKLAKHRHLMFHELWIGPPPMHRRFIGWGQKRIVCDLHRRFNPILATTTMAFYQRRLSREGIKAQILPLFGNIPLASRDDHRIAGLLRSAGSRQAQDPRSTFLNGIFFGTVHPNFKVEPFIHWLKELQSRAGRPLLLSFVGRTGPGGSVLAQKLIKSMPEQVESVLLGEQPSEVISQAIQFADFGINTGSPEHLGKSGTFAAMKEHGLPVVLSDGEIDCISFFDGSPPILQFSVQNSLTTLLNYTRVAPQDIGVTKVALDLIRRFKSTAIDSSVETLVREVGT
jgi:hypothetical protein